MTTNQETPLRERLLARAKHCDPYFAEAERSLLREAADALAAHSGPQAGEWVQQLAECFRLAGGDTECVSTAEGQARHAVAVVRDLRACYDEALAALEAQASAPGEVAALRRELIRVYRSIGNDLMAAKHDAALKGGRA